MKLKDPQRIELFSTGEDAEPEGEIDMATAPQLAAALGAVSDRATRVVVDLSAPGRPHQTLHRAEPVRPFDRSELDRLTDTPRLIK